MKRIYISIPITGHPIQEVKERAKWLKNGLTVNEFTAITPFDVCTEENKPYSYYMGRDIEALLECEIVFFSKGWQQSRGCRAEYEIAKIYDKEIIFERV